MKSSPCFQPVLLGTDVNAYGMARSFHEQYGLTSAAIGKGRLEATVGSQIVRIATIEPELEDDEVFCRTLIDYAKKQSDEIPLILAPCGDNYIASLIRNQEILRPYYLFSCPRKELLTKLSIKENFYTTCQEYGLPFPATTTCTPGNYKEAKLPFPFPVVIKPSNSVNYWNCSFPLKKKVFIANDEGELQAIIKAVYSSSYQDPLILQEYIPGDDSNIRVLNCYSGHDGTTKFISVGHTLLEEQDPSGIGNSAAIINIENHEISERVRNFLDSIGYVGYSNFDLKYDARDDSYKFFEVNLRQARSSYSVTAGGNNLAKWLVDDLLDNKPLDYLPPTEGHVLWTLLPTWVIFRYLKNPELLAQVRRLAKDHMICHSLDYPADRNPIRLLLFMKNQLLYVHNYRKYSGNRGLR